MNEPLYQFFTSDHRRVEQLLDKATANMDEIEMTYYDRFRVGLLTHIKMEELILFPAAQKANGGQPLPLAAKLRLDHGAITALMVVPPDKKIVKVLRHVLDAHDLLEEQKGGMYEACEQLTKTQTDDLLEQLKSTPEIPVRPHVDTPALRDMIKRALQKAGFDFEKIVGEDKN